MTQEARSLAPLSAGDPVVARDETMASVTARICEIALAPRVGRWWYAAMALAVALVLALLVAIGWLFYAGIGVWGVDWPVSWGFAIINYVWWIAVASGGTFVSALFYLLKVEWRSSINRIAETMMLAAALCAAVFPILHLGRPWLFYWLFPYPNTMLLWPQFRSPLLWDFFAILAYVVSSLLFWLFGLIPDFATLRDRAEPGAKRLLYGALALGFRGSSREWRRYQAGYGVMAALLAPLVVSVHSIVGLDFAGAATVGWHSSQFPPFFVFGAFLSGFASVLLLVIACRRVFALDAYVTGRHFDALCKLLLASSLAVGYAYLMEAFFVFYGADAAERLLFLDKLHGAYAPIYWATIVFNLLAPQALWLRRARLNERVVASLCVGVIIGMWCERYMIVVMSLRRTHLPSAWGDYAPTIWDWLLLFGTIGLFLFVLLIAARIVPVLAMSEMRSLIARRSGEAR